MKWKTGVAIGAAGLVWLSASTAWACSCIQTCANEVVAGDKLPSGAEGLYWNIAGARVEGGMLPDGAIALEKEVDGEYQAVAHVIKASHPGGFWHIIGPKDGAFAAGEKWRLTTDVTNVETCKVEVEGDLVEPLVVTEVEIVDVQPGPKLTASVSDAVEDSIEFESDAMCDEKFDAIYRDVTIELPTELAGLENSLFFEVFVDGQFYKYESSSCAFQNWPTGGLDIGRVISRLAAPCQNVPDYAANGSLTSGTHEVQVHAFLPESTVFKWSSDPFMVDLTCTNPPTPTPDMGNPGPPDMGPGPGPGPGPNPMEPEPDMGQAPPMEEEDPEDPTGCAQGAGSAPAPLGGLALFVFGLLGLRRRRP